LEDRVHHFVLLLMMAMGVDRVGHAGAFVDAIAWTVEHDAPPPGMTPDEGAALLIVSLAEEGQFCLGCERGDQRIHPHGSVCSGQVRAFSEAHARELEESPLACARGAYFVIREGARICPKAILAPYAGGCGKPAAEAISRRRVARALGALGSRSLGLGKHAFLLGRVDVGDS
jgi:hypothetical protein